MTKEIILNQDITLESASEQSINFNGIIIIVILKITHTYTEIA